MKTLKLTLLLITITLINYKSHAQKCKEGRDPFSDKITKEMKSLVCPSSFGKHDYLHLTLKKEGETYSVIANLQLDGELDQTINKGDSILIKLNSGEIIKLYAASKATPSSRAAMAGTQPIITTQYLGTFNIKKSEIEQLSQSLTTYIKMNVGDVVYQKEIPDKRSKNLKKGASCMIE